MIQVGQCGNQIGRRFWELALVEHAKSKSDADFDLGPDFFSFLSFLKEMKLFPVKHYPAFSETSIREVDEN